MAPKRKRPGDGRYSQDGTDGSSRPSPHRPQSLALAHQNPYHGSRRGGRGGSRGGRSSHVGRDSPAEQPSRSTPSAQAVPPASTPAESSQPQAVLRPPQALVLPDSSPAQLAQLNLPFMPSTFTTLTEDVLSSWQETGKKSVIQKTVRMIEEQNPFEASAVFQELLKVVVTGRLDPVEAGSALREILAELSTDDEPLTTARFLDQFSENVEDLLKDYPATYAPLHRFLTSTNISPTTIRELLPTDVVIFLGFARPNFQNHSIKHSTNVLYRQRGFNLLREETEGYAKLMTEYFNAASIIGTSATETWEKVKALIGAFNMDPGRVLDVTLDVFSTVHVRRTGFVVKTLRASSWWPQPKQVEGVETEQHGFTSLPIWAEPDVDAFGLTNDEREKLAAMQLRRDLVFWDRFREKGIAAFFELGGRRILSGEDKAREMLVKAQETRALEEEAQDKKIAETANKNTREKLIQTKEDGAKEHHRAIEDLVWITTAHTFPPPGNATAAQVLGFKFRFYASDMRSAADEKILPNLFSLAALLIKIGFIPLHDLYPHLYPADEDMPAHREKLDKARDEKDRKFRGIGDNALTKAGALFDDTLVPSAAARLREAEARATPSRTDASTDKASTPKASSDVTSKLGEPEDQKAGLLAQLLLIGAIPESLYLLSRFPWLLDFYEPIVNHLNRLLRHMISKVYKDMDQTPKVANIEGTKPLPTGIPPIVGEQDQPSFVMKPTPGKKIKRHMHMEDLGDENDWAFYWEDWSDHVPVCQTIDDVFLLCSNLLNIAGAKIGTDAELFVKLIRIGRWSIQRDPSQENMKRWFDLSKRIFFPALSFTKNTPFLNNELYELLKNYPLIIRFNIYAESYEGQTSRLPDMKHAIDVATLETKDVLKRISKDTVKTMSREFAKPTFANPGIVFRTALSQLESYENIIQMFVDCGSLFSSLGFEVLSWALLNSLGKAGKNRMQADGMLTSNWLKRLSMITGQMHAKYARTKVNPILQYLALQLREGSFADLEILEETVKCMSGVSTDTRYSEEQAQNLAGGPALRQETFRLLGDTRYECQKSAQRLMAALNETHLAPLFLIVIAQEWDLYPHRDEVSNAPLKVLSNNLDKIYSAFTQYLEFLRFTTSVEEFDKIVPDLRSLIADFQLEPRTAFQISRQSLRARLAEADKAIANQKRDSARATPDPKLAVTNGDAQMNDAPTDVEMEDIAANGTSDAKGSTDNAKSTEAQDPNQEPTDSAKDEDTPMEDAPQTVATPVSAPVAASASAVTNPVLTELSEQLVSILPAETTENLSLMFYLRFWSMGLHDIFVPSSGYLEGDRSFTARINATAISRTDDIKMRKAKEEERPKLVEQKETLNSERQKHLKENYLTDSVLKKEKDQWFAGFAPYDHQDATVSEAIIDHCFLPRIMTSIMDAKYVNKFLWRIHELATPGFHTLRILSYMFEEEKLLLILFQCTEAEAGNLGHFFNDLFNMLRLWHGKKEDFEIGAWGLNKQFVGFVKEFNEDPSKNVLMDYEDFRRILFQWHSSLHNVLKSCLSSGDDTKIRNAIKCLTQMQREFPSVTFHGSQTLSLLIKLSAQETREDIKRMAEMASGTLKALSSTWIMPQAFKLSERAGQKEPGPKEAGPSNPSSSAAAESSKPNEAESGTKLDATAPEFKPNAGQANGVAPKAGEDGEQEDGEVVLEDKTSPKTVGTNAGVEPKPTPEGKVSQEARKEEDRRDVSSASAGPSANLESKRETPQKATEARVSSRAGTPAAAKAPSRAKTPEANSRRPAQVSLPSRPEAQMPSSQARPPHALPARPEVGPPRDRISHHAENRGQHFPRHAPPHDARRTEGRLELPDDMPRYGTRGRGRDRSPGPHSNQRTPERGPPYGHDRRDGPNRDFPRPNDRDMRHPPRETRSSANLRSDARNAEPPRDRYSTGSRLDASPRPPVNAEAPNRPVSSSDRASQASSERPSVNQQSEAPKQPVVNPQRQDMIDRENRRQDSGRGSQDTDQRPSRLRSPARRDVQGSQRVEPSQDQRHDNRGPPSDRGQQPPSGPAARDRQQQTTLPPSGPRNLRSGPVDTSSRPREPLPSARPPVDNGQSLHPEQEFAVPSSRAPEPTPTQSVNPPDIPSGPRDGLRGRGRGRAGSRDFRHQEPISPAGPLPSPNTDRPPFFPRDSRRPAEAPVTHPPSAPKTPASATSQADTSGVHPSRLSQIQPTLQTNIPTAPSSHPPASAPSGPRGPRPSSSGNFPLPSPTGRPPPVGPMSATDQRDRRFTNFQNAINQAGSSAPSTPGDRRPSLRSRASNAGPGGPAPSVSVPPTPASTGAMTSAAPTRTDGGPAAMRPEATGGLRRESQRGREIMDDRERPDGRNSRRSDGGPPGGRGEQLRDRDRDRDRDDRDRGSLDNRLLREERGPRTQGPAMEGNRERERDNMARDVGGDIRDRERDDRNLRRGPPRGRDDGRPMGGGPHGFASGGGRHMGGPGPGSWESRGPPSMQGGMRNGDSIRRGVGPGDGYRRDDMRGDERGMGMGPPRNGRDGDRGDRGDRGGRKRGGGGMDESPQDAKRPRRSGL